MHTNSNLAARAALALICLLAAACGSSVAEADDALDAEALSAVSPYPTRAACAPAQPGTATCYALVRTDLSGADASTAKPQGLGADDSDQGL